MEDQLVIACVAVVAFAIAALWYCWSENRKSRINIEPNEMDGW